jgi:ubiquinone/menaquinone biosynthesis C-methylase UbiE
MRSGKRLAKYLQQKKTALNILEVGCGNGWLSAQLANIENSLVTGIDINDEELEQAQRVFKNTGNLHFISGDLRENIVQDNIFDIIIFAASLQYFPSVNEIINRALKQLTLQGEIHIIDTHFYTAAETAAAKQRTENYFASVGFETMANFYFHHSINELERFNHKFLYNPSGFLSRFIKNKNPFHHVVIKNSGL